MSRRCMPHLTTTLIVSVALAYSRAVAQPADGPLPNVVVLATGGTIAGAAASDVQAGYTSGQVGVEQLLAAVPQARKLANLRGEQTGEATGECDHVLYVVWRENAVVVWERDDAAGCSSDADVAVPR